MKKKFLCLIQLCVFSSFAYSQAECNTVVYENDFEDETLEEMPSNWNLIYSGFGAQYQKVTDIAAYEGSNSFQLEGQDGFSATASLAIDTVPDVINIEGYVNTTKVEASANGASIAWFGLSDEMTLYAVVNFAHNGDLYLNADNWNSFLIGSFNENEWYKVNISYDKVNKTASVWINDVLKANSLDLSTNSDTPTTILASSENDTHTRTWFDKITVCYEEVIETNECNTVVYENDFEDETLEEMPSNWNLIYSGFGAQYQKVTDIAAYEGSNSFQLEGQDGFSATASLAIDTVPDVINIEGYVNTTKVEASANGASIAWFGLSDEMTLYAVVNFAHNGDLYLNADNWNSFLIGSFNENEWYKVNISYDKVNKTASVWINDVLKANSLDLSTNSDTPTTILASSENDTHTRTWFDKITVCYEEVIETNECNTVVYENDFEDETLEEMPSNWNLIYSGFGAQYQKVTDIAAYEGSNSFQLEGQDGFSATASLAIDTVPDVINIEGYVNTTKVEASANGASIAWFGLSDEMTLYAVVNFAHNGDLYLNADNWNSFLIGSFNENEWYKVNISYDKVNKTASVWINDVLKANSLDLSTNSDTPTTILASSENDTHTRTWFDKITVCYEEVIETNECNTVVYENDFEDETLEEMPSNWNLIYSGFGAQYQKVTDIAAYEGSNSFQLEGQDGFSATASLAIDTVPDVINIEGYVNTTKVEASANGASIAWFGLSDEMTLYAVVNFAHNGDLYLNADNWNSFLIGSFNENEWYKVNISYDKVNKTASVWINDVLKANSLDLSTNSDTPTTILASSENDTHTRTWFDKITVCYEGSTDLGVEENNAKTVILVYPNPTNDFLNILGERNKIQTIQIIDLQGKLIANHYPAGNSTVINVESLTKGMYTIRLFTKDSVITKMFIKE